MTATGFLRGFGAGDTVDLLQTAVASLSLAYGGGNTVATAHVTEAPDIVLTFSGSLALTDVSDGHMGTLITFTGHAV